MVKISQTTNNGTKTDDIVDYLLEKMHIAKTAGHTSLVIKSKEIHTEMGFTSASPRYPMVCQAMRKVMKDGIDKIRKQPPKGNGATLEIEYFL